MSHLGGGYPPHAHHGYELGAAPARISCPSELVVTVANSIGDPVTIYSRRRRGWVFPPPWPGVDWENIPDEPAAIKLFYAGGKLAIWNTERWLPDRRLPLHYDPQYNAGRPEGLKDVTVAADGSVIG